MKKSILLAIACIFYSLSFAQTELVAQHNEKGMFLNHTVSAKESFYSLGRLYNVPAKDIAAFNGVEMEKGLSIGQTIRIPLNSSNFSQQSQTGKPVFYIVGQKEGLYRVSVNNNKVLMANLRKWNNLANDNVATGQKLIVGYMTGADVPPSTVITPEKKQPEVTEIVQKKVEEPVQLEEKPVKKQESVVRNVSDINTTSSGGGGYFKSQFDLQVKVQPLRKDETVTAGIFKTASGWQDGKYYALIDNIEPGTIIRIVNPNNNKSIYAKVLDRMSGIRQNQGYDIRLSNAAANALDIPETDKFFVRVNY